MTISSGENSPLLYLKKKKAVEPELAIKNNFFFFFIRKLTYNIQETIIQKYIVNKHWLSQSDKELIVLSLLSLCK